MVQVETVNQLISQIKSTGLPYQLHDEEETYVVLSLRQLSSLLNFRDNSDDGGIQESFTAKDFGLTQQDINDYNLRKHERQKHSAPQTITELPADLERRLKEAKGTKNSECDLEDSRENHKQLLTELESLMYKNLVQFVNEPEPEQAK